MIKPIQQRYRYYCNNEVNVTNLSVRTKEVRKSNNLVDVTL